MSNSPQVVLALGLLFSMVVGEDKQGIEMVITGQDYGKDPTPNTHPVNGESLECHWQLNDDWFDFRFINQTPSKPKDPIEFYLTMFKRCGLKFPICKKVHQKIRKQFEKLQQKLTNTAYITSTGNHYKRWENSCLKQEGAIRNKVFLENTELKNNDFYKIGMQIQELRQLKKKISELKTQKNKRYILVAEEMKRNQAYHELKGYEAPPLLQWAREMRKNVQDVQEKETELKNKILNNEKYYKYKKSTFFKSKKHMF